MAVTVHQQPLAIVPAHAPMIFEATSTQIASANFTYTIRVTDMITSSVQDYPHEQRPVTGECVFDVRDFVKDFIKNYIPNNVYGFQKCTDAIRQIRVNIGETYGSTPTYYTGSNIDFIVWNGGMSWMEYPTYTMADYVYKSSTSNWKFISAYNFVGFTPRYKLDNTAFLDKSAFIYCLSSEADDFEAIGIKCYDSTGTLIQQSRIVNPYSGTTTYTNQYVCIDVGRKGLDNISSGLVTGSYPIIPSNCFYYEIEDIGISGDEPPFTYTTRKIIQRFYIACEAKHDLYTLQYLDKPGNFETINFPKFSEITTKNKKVLYRQQPFTLASNTWAYTKFTGHEKTQYTEEDQSYTITTDWLSEEQAAIFAHVIHAGVVYIDLGSTIGLVPVIIETNSMIRPKKWNTPKMRAIQISFRYTFKEVWQYD